MRAESDYFDLVEGDSATCEAKVVITHDLDARHLVKAEASVIGYSGMTMTLTWEMPLQVVADDPLSTTHDVAVVIMRAAEDKAEFVKTMRDLLWHALDDIGLMASVGTTDS